jgi:hypothetical protein
MRNSFCPTRNQMLYFGTMSPRLRTTEYQKVDVQELHENDSLEITRRNRNKTVFAESLASRASMPNFSQNERLLRWPSHSFDERPKTRGSFSLTADAFRYSKSKSDTRLHVIQSSLALHIVLSCSDSSHPFLLVFPAWKLARIPFILAENQLTGRNSATSPALVSIAFGGSYPFALRIGEVRSSDRHNRWKTRYVPLVLNCG